MFIFFMSFTLIMVLVHMSNEFLHHTILFLDKLNKIVFDLDADTFVGGHSHSVQFIQQKGKTININSPGKFFINKDGDSIAIIRIYINNIIKKDYFFKCNTNVIMKLMPKFLEKIQKLHLMSSIVLV